ncbi:MAG: TlpA disulfide reductase family protein [Chloroflexota bacterium]
MNVNTVVETPTIISDAPPQQNIWWRIGRWGAALLVIGLIALLSWGVVRGANGPRDSGIAPDFSLTSFNGQTITLSQLRGQVIVINFWASWCQPCRQEAPYLERTWRKYKDKGVTFIGVNWVDTQKEAIAYLAEFNITYFNGVDVGTRIAQAYRIQGIPETFFVDKTGRLRGVHIGPMAAPQLDNKIDELLNEK